MVIILVAVQMGLSPHTRGNPWPFDNASCYLIRQRDNGDLLAAIYQIRPSPSTVSLDLRVPTLGWHLPQPAAPSKYQDSYLPIPREPPTYAMTSPHRRLSQPQPSSNARHQAYQPGPAHCRHPQPPRPRPLRTGAAPDARTAPKPPPSLPKRVRQCYFRFRYNPRFDRIQTQCALMPTICHLAGLKVRTPIMID